MKRFSKRVFSLFIGVLILFMLGKIFFLDQDNRLQHGMNEIQDLYAANIDEFHQSIVRMRVDEEVNIANFSIYKHKVDNDGWNLFIFEWDKRIHLLAAELEAGLIYAEQLSDVPNYYEVRNLGDNWYVFRYYD